VKGFLFDENLPRQIEFQPSLPVIHATSIGARCTDDQLWQYATENALVVVSKDIDFSQRIVHSTPPPWVVHLQIGNLRRKELDHFLQQIWPRVEELLPTRKLLNVYLDRIESIAT
jgi:predicted nuclease of predicted toxin-antitoxin system